MASSEIRSRSNPYDKWIALVLFILAIPVRFKNISFPSQVVFDEVHFGKYAAYYIKQSYFFDVHPPLAKLLITFIAWICGFNGSFEFEEIGMEYPNTVPFVQMRTFGALFGALVIPLAYLTIRGCGHSNMAAIAAAIAICFENGLVANNRLILLDSYLLFFTAFTIFAYTKFYQSRAFKREWWQWLLLTGVGIGCSFTSKWVGLFTMATVGLSTIKQLWYIWGNLQVTKSQFTAHFIFRFIGLFILPIILYISCFYIHFAILTQPGPGDTFMTVEFQNELKGIDPVEEPVPIVYGSLITIRHLESVNGYLHSHKSYYPEGSQQQQITLYPFRDDNNWWRILKANETEQELIPDILANDNKTWLQYVRHGDLVRLEHVETAPRKLHSHDVAAPVTDTTYHKEVSGYGFPDFEGDSNDFWKVEIEDGDKLEARKVSFRLYHPNQSCRLYSNMERLPDWGFQQLEVSCIVEGTKPKTLWKVDQHENDLLPDSVPRVLEPRPSFYEKFIYLQKKMWTVNKDLTDTHPYESRPSAWPVLLSGIAFWSKDTRQIILLGNPLIYWVSTVSVFNFLILAAFFQLRDKRGYHDHFGGQRQFYENSAGFFVAAWAIHYLPFYFMKRQLFLHHYMPSLYFAVLTMGVGIDLVTRKVAVKAKPLVLVVITAAIIYTYLIYAPITYGETWSLDECQRAESLGKWQLDCGRYAVKMHPVSVKQEEVEVEEEEWVVTPTEPLFESQYEEMEYEEMEYEDMEYEEDDPTATLDDDEEDLDDEPTELPEAYEPEPQFVNGTELVAGDDDDEDEWPRTVYGTDPDAEEEDAPVEIKDIPLTRHIEL
ncbi:hypothetical protein G6F68_003622 [Rhizopus microsporus]|nr:hypothetical protein G6F67_004336 [Rhizopus microsporus]KAG1265379.1 hypothetical protein G6F68_003622 [Rhizopus microsporus]